MVEVSRSLRGVVVVVALGLQALAVGACSDDAESGGGAGSSNAGMAGTASSSGGSGGSSADGPCRTGSPTDGPALFAKYAGSYTFPGRKEACTFQGVTFEPNASYGVTLSAKPEGVKLTSSDAKELFAIAWDGTDDVACSGDFVDSFELNDGTNVLRVSFLNDKPSSLSVGTCVFVLD